MRYAIVENGTVKNIVKADAPLADNWTEANGARIGDTWDGTDFTTPVPDPAEALAAERAGMTMTRPELVRATGLLGILATKAERREFASGIIPAAMQALIDGLTLTDDELEWVETVLLTGTRYDRVSPLWAAPVADGVLTDTQLDDVYRQIASER